MDNFKEFLGSKRTKKPIKKVIELDESKLVDPIEPDTTVSIKIPNNIIASNLLQEDSMIPTFSDAPKSGFIGAFNYVPEPSMFTEGAEYRNNNNGTVYKKVGNLWETYIRDGKNGAQGMSVGGGCGVNEVKSITNQLTAETLFLLSSQTAEVLSAASTVKSMTSDFNSIFLYTEGPSTGSYSAVIKFYTIVDGIIDLVATSNISNSSNKDNAQILTSNKIWFATLEISSGTIPSPGVVAKVMR